MRGNKAVGNLCRSGIQFQFTPLHERQRAEHSPIGLLNQFQFTPLHERQLNPICNFQHFALFQFTPLHERQQFSSTSLLGQRLFQFTPLHERQQIVVKLFDILQNFNSRLCMRGNHAVVYRIWSCSVFQFTPLHERQLKAPQSSFFSASISIHASA